MTAEEHQKKFENTEKLIKESCMHIDSTEHLDWLAILMFYGAVDIVEKQFALRKQHYKDHPARNDACRQLKAGESLHSAMLLLYNGGLDARYYQFLSREDVSELAKEYNRVKSIFGQG